MALQDFFCESSLRGGFGRKNKIRWSYSRAEGYLATSYRTAYEYRTCHLYPSSAPVGSRYSYRTVPWAADDD